MKQSILLHTCCAPCLCYVYDLLSGIFDVKVYFYNPNIQPRHEHDLRQSELERFVTEKGIDYYHELFSPGDWSRRVRKYRDMGERSQRCWECYSLRLERTFLKASELGIDLVGTVLSISPHKDVSMINSIGNRLAGDFGIGFFEADFKKKEGFKRSVELSAFYGFYRQDYCGCIYSKQERERKKKLNHSV